ncbi:hypothetical protein SDC9_160875 [bioreactor metagenome]|uniref:Uncharacterized protein n=1 Tax=bioreactor metagenome TaxID=1076179 RepID=A0A645FMB3_9ZZZZ
MRYLAADRGIVVVDRNAAAFQVFGEHLRPLRRVGTGSHRGAGIRSAGYAVAAVNDGQRAFILNRCHQVRQLCALLRGNGSRPFCAVGIGHGDLPFMEDVALGEIDIPAVQALLGMIGKRRSQIILLIGIDVDGAPGGNDELAVFEFIIGARLIQRF